MTAFKTKLRCALVGLLVMPAVAFGAGESAISEPTPILLDTDSYYFWRTATGGTMRVEWSFPLNATVANLAVTGRTFKVALSGIRTEYADLELPTPATAKDEDVLDFTLSFNDGSVKTASLGLVRGSAGGRWRHDPNRMPCLHERPDMAAGRQVFCPSCPGRRRDRDRCRRAG